MQTYHDISRLPFHSLGFHHSLASDPVRNMTEADQTSMFTTAVECNSTICFWVFVIKECVRASMLRSMPCVAVILCVCFVKLVRYLVRV